MDTLKEKQAVDQVVVRLTTIYPQVDHTQVDALVRQIASKFDDASVRDYVPILVEHSAKNRLRQQLLGNPAA